MSCCALELSDGRAVLHCSTSGVVFGKVFPSPDAVDEFAFYCARVAGYRDPRIIPDDKIEDVTEAWRAWSPSKDERLLLGRIDERTAEDDWDGLKYTALARTPNLVMMIHLLTKAGLVEQVDGHVVLTDMGRGFAKAFL